MLRPASLLPALSQAFDAPLWLLGSLPTTGACYRALRRLPRRIFHPLEERVFQDAPWNDSSVESDCGELSFLITSWFSFCRELCRKSRSNEDGTAQDSTNSRVSIIVVGPCAGAIRCTSCLSRVE